MTRQTTLLLLLALAFALTGPLRPTPAVAQIMDQTLARDETSRLAVAVLGRICLLNLGDIGGIIGAAAPGGEFGFTEAPEDVTTSMLQGKEGYVRVLRRPGLGAVILVASRDGICSVWSELAEPSALTRHLQAMFEKGGLKGGGQLLPLDARDSAGTRVTDYYVMPKDWYAQQLAKRFGTDGTQPLPLVTTVSNPGARPMEAVLSVSRQMTAEK